MLVEDMDSLLKPELGFLHHFVKPSIFQMKGFDFSNEGFFRLLEHPLLFRRTSMLYYFEAQLALEQFLKWQTNGFAMVLTIRRYVDGWQKK